MPKTFIDKLNFLKHLPAKYAFYNHLAFPFSAKDISGAYPFVFLELLLKKKKKHAQFYTILYDMLEEEFCEYKAAYCCEKKRLKDFANDININELYIEFTFKTTSTLSHSTMVHIKKNGKNTSVFFKNSFGNCLKGDFSKDFPILVDLFKEVFNNVEIVSDNTQQQSLSSVSCCIINYFNMVDHALNKTYRIPKVDLNGNNSPEVERFRRLLAKDYERFYRHYQEAKESAETKGALKFPELVGLREKMDDVYCHDTNSALSLQLLKDLQPLFDFQVAHFLKKMDKFSLESLSSEKYRNKIKNSPITDSFSPMFILFSWIVLVALFTLHLSTFSSILAGSAISLILIRLHRKSIQNQNLKSKIVNNEIIQESTLNQKGKPLFFNGRNRGIKEENDENDHSETSRSSKRQSLLRIR